MKQLPRMMELLSPAGNLPSLKAAVDNGADAVYFGFRDATNARHFAGLNFTDSKMEQGIRYARQRGVKLLLSRCWQWEPYLTMIL